MYDRFHEACLNIARGRRPRARTDPQKMTKLHFWFLLLIIHIMFLHVFVLFLWVKSTAIWKKLKSGSCPLITHGSYGPWARRRRPSWKMAATGSASQNFKCYPSVLYSRHPKASEKHWFVKMWGGCTVVISSHQTNTISVKDLYEQNTPRKFFCLL